MNRSASDTGSKHTRVAAKDKRTESNADNGVAVGRNVSPKKVGILVAGMHRSGTSAVTRILSILGCDLPKTLLAPHPSNERGFWESPEIVHINRQILVSAGSDLEEWRADEWRAFDSRWYSSPVADQFRERVEAVLDREFGDSRLFVIKDPRLCRLLPFWLEALKRFGAQPLVVSPIRNPLDVAESLRKRDGIDRSIGNLMWLQHVLSSEAASRGVGRAYLRYEKLVSRPHAVVDRLCDVLGVVLPRRMSDVDAEIDEFLSPELRHHRSEDIDVFENPRNSHWIQSSFEIFDRWANGKEEKSDTARLNRIKARFDEAMQTFDPAIAIGLKTTRELSAAQVELVERDEQVAARDEQVATRDEQVEALNHRVSERKDQLSTARAELADRDRRIAEWEQTVADLLASNSWRLTRPLREISATFGRLSARWRAAVQSVSFRARRLVYFARRFLFLVRAFGLRAACRRARIAIVARMRPVTQIGIKKTPLDPVSVLSLASVPRYGIPESTEPCPSAAMLVENFHDGGLEKVVIDIAKQFLRQGIVCPILVAGSAGHAAEQAEEVGCTVQAFNGDTAKLLSVVREDRIEVLMTHHCYEPLDQLSTQGVKIIEVLHNVYFWQRDHPHLADLRSRCVDRFVAVSDFVRDYALAALSIAADRILVIENGLSRYGLIRPPLRNLSRRRKATVGRPLLVHLANAHPQKNHIAILRAFKNILPEYPGADLVLAGALDDSTDVGRSVHAEVVRSNLHGHVRCSGPLERREVSRLLANAHVGLLPSVFEGFSIASLEYAYFGLPTVLSDTGAARRLANQYEHAVIADPVAFRPEQLDATRVERQGLDPDPSTVAGINAAIHTVLANYDRFADKAQRAGRDWEGYSIESVAHQYRRLLMETVE